MTHVVIVKAARFYRVYVEDEQSSMSENEVVEAAKELIVEDVDGNAMLDPELGFEEQDIIEADYEYPIYD